MDNPRTSGPRYTGPERRTPRNPENEGYFQTEFEFLDSLSNLVDTLKRFKSPDRKATQLDLLGGNNDLRTIPESLSWIPGINDLSALHVSLISEDAKPVSTTLELYGDFVKIHLSRDADSVGHDSDALITDDGEHKTLPRVPNAEINDFLYTLTRRGQDPALSRLLDENPDQELVVGEEMSDALQSCAIRSTTNYEYQLGPNRSLHFSLESGMDGVEKLASVDLYYEDRDMDRLVVHIVIGKGLNIQFRRLYPSSEEGTSPVYPDRVDYLIVQRIIREITREMTDGPSSGRHLSLEDITIEELERIQAPDNN